jgi:hypothetical protein
MVGRYARHAARAREVVPSKTPPLARSSKGGESTRVIGRDWRSSVLVSAVNRDAIDGTCKGRLQRAAGW